MASGTGRGFTARRGSGLSPGGGGGDTSAGARRTMRIGVPRETKPGENRVAVTPRGVRALRESGAEVVVETGAGEASGFEDRESLEAGARIARQASEAWVADLVVKVKEPLPTEFRFLSESSTLLTFLHLAAFPRR